VIIVAKIAVVIAALLLSAVVTARLGFFKFGKTILGSIGKKPATLMYPVVPREWEERTRGSVSIDGDNCIACGMCERACPTNAIAIDKAEGKWVIQRMQCIQCSACVDCCPKKCLTMENLYTIPDVVKVVDEFDIPKKAPKAPKKDDAAAPASSPDDGDLTCADSCVFCGLCAKACPADAIKVDRKEKLWEVDTESCVKCGACIDKCPKGSLSFGGAAAEAAPAEAPADEDGDLTCADSCVFCGLCAKACPADAIEVDRKEKLWKVDVESCVKCGACIDKCPKGSLSFGGAAEEAAPAEPAKKSIASVKEGECIGCNACVNQCPADAIPPVVESEWKLEDEKCIGCGACVDACPVDALEMKEV